VIKSNSKLIRDVAKGKGTCETDGGFYPIVCEPGTPTYETCSQVGLIACNSDTNKCPAFFQVDATASDDKISGGVMFFISICLLFVCLGALVVVLSKMLGAVSNRVIYKCSNINGYLAIAIGCGLTVLVQSSSVVTSALTPFVGLGAIRLEQMYPLTLGSNIGTVREKFINYIKGFCCCVKTLTGTLS
jgi:solute carrier family 34 (sodium-dependent phosphate cotransporter)